MAEYQKPSVRLSRTDDGQLDDTFITGAVSAHFELMSHDTLWLCVDLVDGERVTFNVHAKRGVVSYSAGELPKYADDGRQNQEPERKSNGDV